jgi:LPXTG-motif cell wall-anchored protein
MFQRIQALATSQSTLLRRVSTLLVVGSLALSSAFAQQGTRAAGPHSPTQPSGFENSPVGAPEISPALIVSGMILLIGGALIVLGRRRQARAS